ncbi:MAG: DUF2203 domain-containing protein [Actinomycetota bacterium]
MAEPVEPEHFYSVEEANSLLPSLRERLERIREARRKVVASAETLRHGATANGGGAEESASLEAMATLRTELEALTAAGIVLRDADTGLIDFPTLREGRLVYLCWRPDEDQVSHWHEVDAGFGGRKPL